VIRARVWELTDRRLCRAATCGTPALRVVGVRG
jgi:hypothetical protein